MHADPDGRTRSCAARSLTRVKGELVIKLPGARVDELIEAGLGRRFDPGHGRLMREWVSLTPSDVTSCREFMAEALAFVATSATWLRGGLDSGRGAIGDDPR